MSSHRLFSRQFRARDWLLRGGLLAVCAALTPPLYAGGHNQLKEPAIAMDQALTTELDAVLNEYEDLWNAQEPAKLIEMWDQDDPEPFYLAEEQDEWRIGWDQVKNYWDPPGPSGTEALRMRFDGVQARMIADDLAFAKFWIRFDTKMKFMPKPIGTDARASAIFRKKPEGWRLITWAESPLSPILYVQKLYEMRMRPDFPAFMEQVKQDKAAREAAAAD